MSRYAGLGNPHTHPANAKRAPAIVSASRGLPSLTELYYYNRRCQDIC